MNQRSVALRQERKRIHEQNELLLATADKRDKPDLTADETKIFDDNLERMAALDEQIKRHEAHEQAGNDLKTVQPVAVKFGDNTLPVVADQTEKPTFSFKLPAVARRWSKTDLARKGFLGDDPHRDAFASGMHLAASQFGNRMASAWCRQHGIDVQDGQMTREQAAQMQYNAAGLVENDNTKGGVLVLPEFENAVIQLRQQFGVFRKFAKRVPMATETKQQPRKTSGLTAYAVGEGAAGTETTSGWDSVLLVARTWQVNTRMSMELSEDSIIDLAADTAEDSARAFAYSEDQAGFLGTGTSTYHGIFGLQAKLSDASHTACVSTGTTGHTTYATLTVADFTAIVGLLPLYPGIRPAWFMSQAAYYNSAGRLKYVAGGTRPTDLESGVIDEWMGYPVVISQALDATLSANTNTYAFFFGDLNMASLFGDRRGMTLASNPYEYMSQRQISMYATERFDINNANLGDSAAATDFSTVGPMVVFRFPAS